MYTAVLHNLEQYFTMLHRYIRIKLHLGLVFKLIFASTYIRTYMCAHIYVYTLYIFTILAMIRACTVLYTLK